MHLKTGLFFLHFHINFCFSSNDSNTCSKDSCYIEEGVPIHWDLTGLHQNDPKLIEAIKNKVLWPIPISKKLNLYKPPTISNIKGQYGQPLIIEEILKVFSNFIF